MRCLVLLSMVLGFFPKDTEGFVRVLEWRTAEARAKLVFFSS